MKIFGCYPIFLVSFLLFPFPVHAEGSPRDLDLALGAVSAAGDYKKFLGAYESAKCHVEIPTAEKISYNPGNHGDVEVILVVQKFTCPESFPGKARKPAVVFSVDLWRENTATVTPDSRFTYVQEVKLLKQAE
jgi:hypothetical protein